MTGGEYVLRDNAQHLVHPALVRAYCARFLDGIAEAIELRAKAGESMHERDRMINRTEVIRGVANEIRADRWSHLL